MNHLVKGLFVLSFLIMFGAGGAFFIVAANHGPESVAVAFIFVAFIGFTLLPTTVAVEWFLPEGKQREYGRVRSRTAVVTLAIAFGYWTYAILVDLMSPGGSFSLISVGAFLLALGYVMVYFVDLTRKRKDLR